MEPPAVSWQTHPIETARADAVVCNGPVDLLATVHQHGARFLWAVSATSRTNAAQRATWGGIADDIEAAKLAAERILYRWQRGILPREPDQFRAVTITPEEVRDAMLAALQAGTIEPFLLTDIVGDTMIVRESCPSDWLLDGSAAQFGDWRITLSIEAGAIYHVYGAQAPDRRNFAFGSWDRDNPWNLLTPAQQLAIHLALGGPPDVDYEPR